MEIPFYFDYACPWAYLGSTRVESYFQDLGVTIDFRPVVLADLKETSGPGQLPPGDRKRSWYVSDIRAWGEMVGAEISLHARDRRPDTHLLLQGALVAKSHGKLREYHYPAYRARWAEARDVDEASVVSELFEAAGLEADAALEEARSPALVDRLEGDTRAAIERGVFGVPSMFVGDRMFFGNDRFELMRHFIVKEQGA